MGAGPRVRVPGGTGAPLGAGHGKTLRRMLERNRRQGGETGHLLDREGVRKGANPWLSLAIVAGFDYNYEVMEEIP